MTKLSTFTEKNQPTPAQKKAIINFLYTHLENFGDPKQDIEKAINYSLKDGINSDGGFVCTLHQDEQIVGAVVVNETGMKDYIPENILVYIATHHDYRGKGLGKKLMRSAINMAKGSIALHVEPDNPAKHLYEKLGFTNKYLEMRLKKEQ